MESIVGLNILGKDIEEFIYNTLDELLKDVRNKFIHTELNDKYNEKNLKIYEYSKPIYNISTLDFYKHCESGKLIDL